jgi:hypothetical protein
LFPIHKPAIETILPIADFIVVESVAVETTAFHSHRDAAVIKILLDTKRIARVPAPTTDVDALIDGYSKVDEGERDTIRLALTFPGARLILDDVAAFVTATHFELSPIMLLDQLAVWAKNGDLDQTVVLRILSAIASRYSEAFVSHTRYKLNEVGK